MHKILIPRKERITEASYLDLTIMELFDTKVEINIPRFIIKHMQRILLKDDKKAHALAYRFWLGSLFESFDVFFQVWLLQTTNDIIGRLNHTVLPISMRQADTLLQRVRNDLADALAKLEEVKASHVVRLESRLLKRILPKKGLKMLRSSVN